MTHFDSHYGTVAEETVTIKLKQTRVDVAGEWRAPIGPVKSVEFRFGHSDDDHTEFEGDEVGTVFKNEGWEARVDAAHAKVGLSRARSACRRSIRLLGARRGGLPAEDEHAQLVGVRVRGVRFDAWRLQFGARYDNAR